MRMLHWINGHTRPEDRIGNECTREKVGAAPIIEKIVEAHRMCFGRHVWRRSTISPIDQMESSNT